MRGLPDIIAAHLDGNVQRVRPKLMTVATMLAGLIPLLWATGSGADVMKRIAAPMVGGLVTSAFLTLEIIPVLVTYWRLEELLWERLAELDPRRLTWMRAATGLLAAGALLALAVPVSKVYVALPGAVLVAALALAVLALLAGAVFYLALRPAARARVWPT